MQKSVNITTCDCCGEKRNEPINEYGIPIMMRGDGIQLPNYRPWYKVRINTSSWDLCCEQCLLDFAGKQMSYGDN
jgi:hypothetical protein